MAGGVGSYREDRVGATAVQVVRASRPGSRALSISARCPTSGNWTLKAAARQRVAAGHVFTQPWPWPAGPPGPGLTFSVAVSSYG